MLFKIQVAQDKNPVNVFKPCDRRGNFLDLKPLTAIFTTLLPTHEIVQELSGDENLEVMQMSVQRKRFGITSDTSQLGPNMKFLPDKPVEVLK